MSDRARNRNRATAQRAVDTERGFEIGKDEAWLANVMKLTTNKRQSLITMTALIALVVGATLLSRPAEAVAAGRKPRPWRAIIVACSVNRSPEQNQYYCNLKAGNGEIAFTSECRHNKRDIIAVLQRNFGDWLAAGKLIIVDPDGDYDARGVPRE